MVSNLPNPVSVTDFYLSAVLATLELVRSEISVLSGEIALLKITMQSQNPPKVSVTVDSSKLVEHLQKTIADIKTESKALKSK